MSKAAIVYWSATGNTEAMAEAVLEGARTAGVDAALITAGDFDATQMDDYDAVAFGCPAMGAEVLEEDEFEPMFTGCEGKLAGKHIGLFGSYGWGDGQWMRDWQQRCIDDGATLVAEPVMANEDPDDDAIAACKALGAALGA